MKRQCQAVRNDGQPCQAAATDGSAFCFFHNPEMEERREQARQRGGRRRWRDYLDKALEHETTATAVLVYLQDVMEQLEQADLDPQAVSRLRAACYAASVALKAVEQADLALRLQALEDTLRRREKTA